MRTQLRRRVMGALAATAALAMSLLAPALALADTELTYEPQANPVADNATRLLVNKLDKDTHEYVRGATLEIIDPAGEVVERWESTGEAHAIEGRLSVNVEYVLHEAAAPDNYTVAEDVTFVLRSEDFNTSGEIVSGGGGNADFTAVSGDGAEQAFVIAMYDKVTPEEEVRRIQREREREQQDEDEVVTEEVRQRVVRDETTVGGREGSKLSKTGDVWNQPLTWALAAAGVAVLAFGLWSRFGKKRD